MIDKFKTCADCPDRKRTVENVNGEMSIYDCHTDCEGYLARQKAIREKNELIREKKFEQRITFLTG